MSKKSNHEHKSMLRYCFMLLIFFLYTSANATTFTSSTSGNWNDGGTWGNASPGVEGTDWPSATDDVVIASGHTVSLTAPRTINNLQIASTGILATGSSKITINGNFDIDGSITSTADIDYFGTSIDGSGTVTLTGKTFKLKTDATVIESTANITFACNFKIDVNDIDLTNNGTITVTGDVTVKNVGNIWTNAANSVVNVEGDFMANNQIEASANPNTINLSTGNQNIFTPVSSYHHLQLTVGGIKTLQGDIDINGDLTITTATLNDNNDNITIAGNWLNNGTFTQGTGTVTFDGTSAVSGSTTTTFPNVVISGSLTGHPTNMNVQGNWTDNGTYTHNSGSVTFTGTTVLGGSNTTTFNDITISSILTGNPTNVNVAGNWVNNGTFNSNSGAVTFTGNTTLSGSATTSFQDVTITGTLTGVSSGNFNVEGDWNNSGGTYTHNSGTVTFNGTTASSISNTGSGNFNNLTINNTTATDAVTINNTIEVDGVLTLTDGHVVTSAGSLITLGTSGTVSGVSDASFVQGPFAKNTNSISTFVFPVGDQGLYRSIEVTPTSTNSTTFTARYYQSNQSLGSGVGAGIDHISTYEYWEMERAGGTPADATVTLSWEATSQVNNLTDLRVSQFDGSNWIDQGNGATTGTTTAGTITSTTVSSFTTKNFVLGSATNNNPLSNNRYTVVASGNWTDASTWAYESGGTAGASVPTSTQNAIIEGGATITLTAETTINDLEIKSGNAVNGATNKLIANGTLQVDGTYTSTADIDFFGTSISGGGTITLTGKKLKIKTDGTIIESGTDLTISDEIAFDVNDIDLINNGTLTVNGDISRRNAGNIWTNAAGSVVNVTGVFMANNQIEASANPNTINFNGSGNQNVYTPVSSYHHLLIGGGLIKSLQGNLDINGDLTISSTLNDGNDNITIAGNWINNGTFTQGSGTVTFDGTTSITGSSITTLPNVIISGTLTGHPTNLNIEGNWTNDGTYTANSGTVTFMGTTTMGGSAITSFNEVVISSSLTGHPTNMNVASDWSNNGTFTNNGGMVTFIGTSTLSGSSTSSFHDITISGSLTGVSSGNFNVAGDWNNAGGTFTHNNGTVTFNGTTASSISNTGSGNFNNLTINNITATDAVTLNNGITVDGVLTLTDGHLVSSASNLITLGTSASVSGTSDASFIQGPVAKNTNTTATFTFPVGDNNSYRNIEITPTSTNATTFTARYYRANQALGTGLGTGIDHISSWEYWELERSGATPANADVTLTWDANSQVDNLTDLRVAQFDGSNWIDNGNDATTGTTTAGTVKANAVSSFTTKNFVLASSTNNNPLSNDRYTVVASGNWSDASTWAFESGGTAGASVPTSTQNAIIEGSATISLTGATDINDLEIKSGNSVSGAGHNLAINGDLVVDGSYTSTGDINYFGSSISGSGTITLTGKKFKVKTDGTIIESGSDLTISDEFAIDVNDIDITNNGTITVTGDITNRNAGNIWTNASGSSVSVSGLFMADNQIEVSASPNTVNYNGNVAQNITIPLTDYHHLQATVGSTKSMQANTVVNGDLTISGTAVLDVTVNNYTLTVGGDWSNTSGAADPFLQQSGSVTLNGTGSQSLTGSETFYDLTINNSNTGNGVTLMSPINISNSLTLLDGTLLTDATNLADVGVNATFTFNPGAIIIGPMIQRVATTTPSTLDFPVGASGEPHTLELNITQDAATETAYTVDYNTTAPSSFTLPSGVVRVTSLGHWTVEKGAGANITSGSVRLYYLASDQVEVPSDLRIVKDDGAGNWINLGGTGTGSPSGSILSTNNFTSFSEFALASSSENNALPVTLLSFKARINEEQQAIISWTTATEHNNDYFILEKSTDGESFTMFEKITGSGDSDSKKSYQVTDPALFYGSTFYRLKQVDFDGQTETFQTIHVVMEEQVGTIPFDIYPNPVIDQFVTLRFKDGLPTNSPIIVTIYDISGAKLKVVEVSDGASSTKIRLDELVNGVYTIRVSIRENSYVQKLIIN
ncbi:T9SS type A sorting domain-containing protein [Ekhidna sp.]|uniref:T9SS type A sorting domain-containing protein n=1 Tax=Ekhidna sp. TaxID=2608089 RepID=UPI003B500006